VNAGSNPGYEGKPVILIHVVLDGTDIAWCADVSYRPDQPDSYRDVPRQMCPACARAPLTQRRPS
jgi:hypothetical protein